VLTITALCESVVLALALVLCLGLVATALFVSTTALEHHLDQDDQPGTSRSRATSMRTRTPRR